MSLDSSRRPMIMLGGAVLVMLVVGAVIFAGRPNMNMLFAGLSPADQGMVVEELNKLGIRAEYDANGNVLVPASKVNEARARLAVAKKLPTSGNLGYGSLDAMNPMISPEVEREKIKAAIEGELSNSIQSMAGVAAARVHLTMGDTSPFAREGKSASASIIITEEPNSRMGPEQANAIVRLVQFAVTGLSDDNITLVNDKGQTLFDGAASLNATASADRKVTAEIEEARRREQDLQRKLDIAFGVGNTVVSIPVLAMNFDKVKENSIERGPSSKPITREEVSESMGRSEAIGGGAAGASSNVQAPADAAGTDSDYKGTQKREEFEINETQRTIERSAGDLEGMTINVLVNSSEITDVAPVQQYVQNYLGPLANDTERFQASVTSVEFDQSLQQASQQATASAAASARNQQIMSMLPLVALLVIGFLLIRSLSKGLAAARPAESQQLEVALPGGGSFALPAGSIDSTGASGRGFTPERAENVIAIEGGELAQALHALAAQSGQVIDIEDIPDKVNVPLEQLKKLASQKPEVVANLIKTWILEERR